VEGLGGQPDQARLFPSPEVRLGQLKVMSAIENCRTAALGGQVARCQDCRHTSIAYNSCRNRHCTKCQGAAARWADREAELLAVPYFHVVFTLPAAIADIAYQNKHPGLERRTDRMVATGATPEQIASFLNQNVR
jgi:Transposase zinc-binding domain